MPRFSNVFPCCGTSSILKVFSISLIDKKARLDSKRDINNDQLLATRHVASSSACPFRFCTFIDITEPIPPRGTLANHATDVTAVADENGRSLLLCCRLCSAHHRRQRPTTWVALLHTHIQLFRKKSPRNAIKTCHGWFSSRRLGALLHFLRETLSNVLTEA